MITYEQFLQIQECKSYDLSVQTTSRKLGIEIYDVRNWWNKTEEEFLDADGRKACELDNYRQYIIELIKMCPQISNANVMSRLQEDFADFDAVNDAAVALTINENWQIATGYFTGLTVAADITAKDELIVTRTIEEGQRSAMPNIEKRPTIFVLGI